ncbi:MAG: putative iron-regulated protein [Oleiphilaceae bacterium]
MLNINFFEDFYDVSHLSNYKQNIALSIAFALSAALAGCQSNMLSETIVPAESASQSNIISSENVIKTYIDIAQANYGDALISAKTLEQEIDSFLASPSEENLAKAKQAWINARIPYQQSEVYRFGNSVVDDWEGKVNAWPLDEGLIDYVGSAYGTESDENPFYAANIIANPKPLIGGKEIDASKISMVFLADTLHEIDEVESNVATGYHVIEFLLWGQDLHGTNPGAGMRPASDYSLNNCTGGNCERRQDYLKSATSLLVKDLGDIHQSWLGEGEAKLDLISKGIDGGLSTMLTGMGSLAYAELAGERIKLGLMLHDPEEEHDCFSDNTHWSHFYDAKGIKNIYLGEYTRIDQSKVTGNSLSQLVRQIDTALDDEMQSKLNITEQSMQVMVDQAVSGNTFDVLIGEGNTQGNKIIRAILDALVDQAKTTEKVILALNLQNNEQ